MPTLQDLLDENLDIDTPSRVKVILLVSDQNECDPDDTPHDRTSNSPILKQEIANHEKK